MTTSFCYQVRDNLGRTIDGSLEAESSQAAAAQLQRDGFEVLEIDEADPPLFPRRITKNEIVYLTSQLAIMVDTGITLSAALAAIGEQEPNPSLRAMLAKLRENVESGEDFSAALARYPRHFDRTYCALVTASEATGSLGSTLESIAGYLRKEQETSGKVRSAMAYPSLMLVLAIGVTIFLLTYVLPKFIPLFESRGVELPTPTRWMITLSNVIIGYWYLLLPAALLPVVAVLVARRLPEGRAALDWIKIHLPVIGPMVRKVTITRSLRTLGATLAGGVPVLEALRMAGDVAGNTHYERVWREVIEAVTAGRRICEVLRASPLFPHVLVQMIAAGEEAGRLDEVLQRVGNYFDREVEMSIKTATSLIEPLMICAVGAIVGTIGLALLLPIFSLSRHP